MTWTVHDINGIAFLHEVGGPSRAAIGSAHPVGSLAASAVDQHNRIGMFHRRRDHVFDVHLLAVHNRSAGQFGALHADPEIAPLGEVERGISWLRRMPRSSEAAVPHCREDSRGRRRRHARGSQSCKFTPSEAILLTMRGLEFCSGGGNRFGVRFCICNGYSQRGSLPGTKWDPNRKRKRVS